MILNEIKLALNAGFSYFIFRVCTLEIGVENA